MSTSSNGTRKVKPTPGTRPGWDELGHRLLQTRAMSRDWAGAFAAVDRARYLPPVLWPADGADGAAGVHRHTAPGHWWACADSDTALVTQWDDGEHDGGEPGIEATSAAPKPSTAMSMLRDLDVRPGMRVLQIGTGSGWTAGLLARRLGGDRVATMDVDRHLARAARRRLADAGLWPTVLERDGLDGDPVEAPYDRLLATCSLRTIPTAWIEQIRPGGIILAPYSTGWGGRDALVKLVVADDGGSASGRFLRLVDGSDGFQIARGQREERPRHEEYVPDTWPATVRRPATHLRPEDLTGRGPADAGAFALGLVVPGATHTVHHHGGRVTAWLYSLTAPSWATVSWPPGGGPGRFYAHGPRELWTEIESAFRWWNAQGTPTVDRFGLTLHAADGEHRVWMDSPDHALPVASWEGMRERSRGRFPGPWRPSGPAA